MVAHTARSLHVLPLGLPARVKALTAADQLLRTCKPLSPAQARVTGADKQLEADAPTRAER